MKAGTFTLFRFSAAVATVALVAARPYIPPKTLALLPAEKTVVSINGYVDPITGVGSAAWIDEAQHYWRCEFEPKHTLNNNCGFSISWGATYVDEPPLISAQKRPLCQSLSADEDGDGWGWEQGASCIAIDSAQVQAAEAPSAEALHCTRPDADRDGNGWGWDANGICRASLASRAAWLRAHRAEQIACPAHAADIDGDGISYFAGRECAMPDAASLPARRRLAAPLREPARLRAQTQADQAAATPIAHAIDFSRYRGINLTVAYEGSSAFMRVYLQNHNPAYARPDNVHTNKFMTKVLLTEDLKSGTTFVSFDGFSVSEWWLQEFEIPRQWAQLEFDRIVGLGVDLVQYGVHRVKVERIELVGDRLPFKTLLIALSLFWSVYLIIEAAVQYAAMRRSAQRGEAEFDELSQAAQQLEEEKRALAQQSVTDSLTGAHNRAGLAQQLYQLSTNGGLDENTGVVVIDIDHFKRINDTFGHTIGDAILRELAEQLSTRVRRHDVLARWGGEEFVLVCPSCPGPQLIKLAEHLRGTIAAHSFVCASGLRLTISLGATSCRAGESFESAFRRADLALYEAKRERDTLIYRPVTPPEVSR